MTSLPPDLFPSILCLLPRIQLVQCSLVNSQMQHPAQALLFSHWYFHDVSWGTQRDFFLSSRGRALAKHIRSITFYIYSINSRSLDYSSEFLGIVQRVVSLKIEASYANRLPNWDNIIPGLWSLLFSKVGEDLQLLTVNAVNGLPLQDVLVKCPHLSHLEVKPASSKYIAEQEPTAPYLKSSQLRSLSLTGHADNHHVLASFLRHVDHRVKDFHFGGHALVSFEYTFPLLSSLSSTLCHLSFNDDLCAFVIRYPDSTLLPVSTLTRLQTLTFGAWSPGIHSTPRRSDAPLPPKEKDAAYPFYRWISRLIQEAGFPLSFATLRFPVLITKDPSIFMRHEELDNLAGAIGNRFDISFEFQPQQHIHVDSTAAVEVVETYLPTWKQLGRLKVRTVQKYQYDEAETHWEIWKGELEADSKLGDYGLERPGNLPQDSSEGDFGAKKAKFLKLVSDQGNFLGGIKRFLFS
ncbi:hypothetical protein DL96DRAFT_1589837 [Flagelloscypha sp. PMI_526]|nr:hypothetical protein DL96DRAFT_1589837 [Flagelloscypha sp. PMI_526]